MFISLCSLANSLNIYPGSLRAQGFYNTRMPNSLALFWTRVFSRPVQFGQTTLNSDVIMLYEIHQVLELKSPKRQLQLKILYQNIMQQS